MLVDIPGLVTSKSEDLLARPQADPWAACIAIWARAYFLASPACLRYPNFGNVVRAAFALSVQRAVGYGGAVSAESILEAMESFDIEDDGSTEWNYMVDFIGMLTTVLEGRDVDVCLESSIRFYLESVFAARSREFAASEGGVVSYSSARERVSEDPEWVRAIDFLSFLAT